jgi:hypothetical protein
MIFKVERRQSKWDTEDGCRKEYWEDLGLQDITLNYREKIVHIGYRDSGMHVFLQSLFNIEIGPHGMFLSALSQIGKSDWELWELRLTHEKGVV